MVLFDLQGREVRVLIDKVEEQGIHTFNLDTKSLSKGIYYYRMRSGNYMAVRRLVVQ